METQMLQELRISDTKDFRASGGLLPTTPARKPIRALVVRMVATPVVVFAFLASAMGSANADTAMHSPEEARGIAIGLIDATGPLAVQCGLGKVGEAIRARNVATAAIKDSLAVSGAKKSCSGVVQIGEAALAIGTLAEAGQQVYITQTQSEKNKWWGAGIIKTCTVTVRAGASDTLAKNFKASFTCH
jgi:hypothetical protein